MLLRKIAPTGVGKRMSIPSPFKTCSIIARITWRTYLFSPLLYLKKNILIFDLSLITLIDERPGIRKLLKLLKFLRLEKKVTVISSHEYVKEIWRSKEDVLLELHNDLKEFRQYKNEIFYFSGYLIHRKQIKKAIERYIQKVCFKKNLSSSLNKKYQFSVLKKLGSIFALFSAPFIFILYSLTRVKISLKSGQDTHDFSLCIDCIHGPGIDEQGGYIYSGLYDTCFAGIDNEFTDKDIAYWAYGSKPAQLEQWDKILKENTDSRIFGDQLKKVNINIIDYVKVICETYKIYFKIAINSFKSENVLLHDNRHLLQYCCERLRVRCNLYYIRPKIYLSRLDYSYRHHPIGAVCNQIGIHFAGLCHSPWAGMGHTPSIATVSFDQFFVHHKSVIKYFFPTWSNPNIKISFSGPWRTDLIYEACNSKNFMTYKQIVKHKLAVKYIIALHLPVLNTCLYDEKLVSYWMNAFLEILRDNEDFGFVLIPRRFHTPPPYFYKYIDALKATGRAVLSTEISKDWKNAYGWIAICDWVVGCTYSDAVAEALAYGKPAVTYADIGVQQAPLWHISPELVHFNKESLANAFQNMRDSSFLKKITEGVYKNLIEKSDGHCRLKILAQLRNEI